MPRRQKILKNEALAAQLVNMPYPRLDSRVKRRGNFFLREIGSTVLCGNAEHSLIKESNSSCNETGLPD
ncbi:hypothetical protein Y1Q_0004125 [Alligator mississippiensis]|uniref:Uncharacterized protein n=1 Tax=Alligator mississippiensis TaxID=8496 RepID=A0A151PI78_ALLMI|nr:hypothetical protein Y1Q_0004125 [Alligator mississippiensis]